MEFKGNQLSRAFSETYQYVPNRLFNATTEKPVLDQKTRKPQYLTFRNLR